MATNGHGGTLPELELKCNGTTIPVHSPSETRRSRPLRAAGELEPEAGDSVRVQGSLSVRVELPSGRTKPESAYEILPRGERERYVLSSNLFRAGRLKQPTT